MRERILELTANAAPKSAFFPDKELPLKWRTSCGMSHWHTNSGTALLAVRSTPQGFTCSHAALEGTIICDDKGWSKQTKADSCALVFSSYASAITLHSLHSALGIFLTMNHETQGRGGTKRLGRIYTSSIPQLRHGFSSFPRAQAWLRWILSAGCSGSSHTR